MTMDPYLSLSNVRECVVRFLETEEASVIAIRGAWGVGKTHFWNLLISEIGAVQLHKSIKSYSYVSLFGIDTLDKFKYSIFENTVPKSMIGKPITLETFSENVGKVSQVLAKKAVKTIFSTKPLSGFSQAVESASFLSVRNSLVCVDDLERKGEKLSARDSLGLISYLKEHRNCKIVLLLNDGEEGMDDYIKYREKVVDIELTYNPSVSDNVSIAFCSDSSIYEIAKKFAIDLGSSNIRTLFKTNRYVNLLSSVLNDLELEVQEEILGSLTLFCLCFYRAGNDSIPPLSYVLEIRNKFVSAALNKQVSDEEKKWNKFLRDYGYSLTNELDRAVARGIEAGFFNLSEIKKLASARNAEVLQQKMSQEFHDAWGLYHNTFEDNEKDLVDKLQTSLIKNALTVSPTNLNGTVVLLRDLDYDNAADKLVEQYIEANKDRPQIFDLESNPFGGDVTDGKIRELFKSEFEKSDNKPSLHEVIKRLASSDVWSAIDEKVLSESTPEEYVQIFDSEKGEHLDSYVKVGLQFRRWSSGDHLRAKIGKNVEDALKIIGARSPLNRRRAEKFGVLIESEE